MSASRQADLTDLDRLREAKIAVIGCGAVGRQVAIQLAVMGAENVDLFDDDVVEEVNYDVQAYCQEDLGQPKAACTYGSAAKYMLGVWPKWEERRFGSGDAYGFEILVSCVDSMTSRSAIYKSFCRFKTPLLLDARVLGYNVQVITAIPETSEAFGMTVFPQSQALEGRCTAKISFPSANLAASLLLHQLSRYLRGGKVLAFQEHNLDQEEYTLSDTHPNMIEEEVCEEVT